MRAGLVFLAGLLVGGLAVAWLVAEVPRRLKPNPALPGHLRCQRGPGTRDPGAAGRPVPEDREVTKHTPELNVEEAVGEIVEVKPEVALASVVAGTETPAPDDTLLLPPLRIPVEGVEARDLFDSFADARGEDRVHDALDIMAAEGTPVLAVADGPVVKLFDSVPGRNHALPVRRGRTGRVLLRAHAGICRRIVEGKQLRQGEVIGYVGHTGNANPAAPHLHFAIFVLGPEKRWWEGAAINPYPLLRAPPR